jgi:DNA-binding GntR family transcriptional regulator
MKKTKILTIPEQIAIQIRQDIFNESYTSKQFLRETELAERFGVSRGPVRQALAQLANEGIIESKPNVGVRVAEHPSDEVFSIIIDLRRRIEHFVIDKIFENLDEIKLKEVKRLLNEIKDACESNDVHSLMLADYAFHEHFVELCEDNHILTLWKTAMSRMMMRYSRFGDLIASYEEHLAIVQAIERGEKDETLRLIERNIQ